MRLHLKKKHIILIVVILSVLPSLGEGYAILWGAHHGYVGESLRDGLDFWVGGWLVWHHQILTVFDPSAYSQFIIHGFSIPGRSIPVHMWSYPPNYLLVASLFGWMSPWKAILCFDVLSLMLLAIVLRLAKESWLFIAAILCSPVALENILEGQNAALMTALIGGGLLLLPVRPRLAGALIGLASIKPQLGVTLPIYIFRRSPIAFVFAAASSGLLVLLSVIVFGAGTWDGFIHNTWPAMSNVLITGRPKEFADGLLSVFACVKPFFGLRGAFFVQTFVTLGSIFMAARTKNPIVVLILVSLASPYLHLYDLLGVSLAICLMVKDRLASDFAPGEPFLFFVGWFGPAALSWTPAYAHLTPIVLLLLLLSAYRTKLIEV
jgi:alpha-1,2-mannosyltransferase